MGQFVESFDPYSEEPEEGKWHDVAQICLNGHVINEATKASPEFNKKFCDHCGAATISQCPRCSGGIQGTYHSRAISIGGGLPVPAFCPECGSPYPWTDAKLQAARDLTQELEGLTDAEKEVLSKSLDDLLKDTPQTPVAATRFKKLLPKVGKEAVAALRDILIDIASETAKKVIWPD